jgi:hypothetical protein
MDSTLIYKAPAFIVMLLLELTLAAIGVILMAMIPVFVSYMVIRPWGEEPKFDMLFAITILFALIKYPYDDIK